jgi:hypothetical protein
VSSLDICHAHHASACTDDPILLRFGDFATATLARCAQIGSPEYEQNSQGLFHADNEAQEWDLRKGSLEAAWKGYVLHPNPVLRPLIVAYSV